MTDLLTGALPPISIDDMISEIERELKLRERVYPRWIQSGKVKQSTADEHMRRLRAVRDLLVERKG